MAEAEGGSFVTATAAGVRCAVRVTPRAARDAVKGAGAQGGLPPGAGGGLPPGAGGGLPPGAGGALPRVSVTAAPHKGAANAAVIRLLAKAWRVPKSSITVQSGASGRTKVLNVAGDPAELTARLIVWERDLIDP